MNTDKHIGIDCRFWGISHAGLGRYTRELVVSIAKQVSNPTQPFHSSQFYLFFDRQTSKEDKQSLKKQGFHIIETSTPHYSFKEQLMFTRTVDIQQLDLIHYPHFNIPILSKTPFVVTIHDLIKHFFKGKPVTTHNQLVYWAKYSAYRLVIKKAIQNSRAIITPSLFVKDQIACNYDDIQENKIKIIYEGVSQPYNRTTYHVPSIKIKKIHTKYKIQNTKFFIYTGSAYHHKDLKTLLLAIKKINNSKPSETKYKLIIACARNQFWQTLKTQVRELKLTKQVILPGKVSDQDLVLLYQNAVAYIFPSLMEGFGLPGLEAMSSGCPVIASDAGSLPEVYGQAAIYFQPGNVDELASKMQAVSNWTPNQRKKVITTGIDHSKQYHWQRTAQQTLETYTGVIANS